MTLPSALSAVFLLSGATSCLLGALGLLRFPDLPARLQAATKPQTLGLLLILLGTALQLDPAGAASLVLVAIFQVITAPVISQLLGRAAYRSGPAHREVLVLDELDEQLSQDDASTR
ncbi:MAG: monovalent cation/H(+) antiporter subunit G [Pseudonocardiaceae bacterium]